MDIQPITYRGRTVAACTPKRVFFSDELDARGPEDPHKRFVCAMCLYAGDVFAGAVPGPYRDDDARIYARAVLIPAELLEQPGPAWSLEARHPGIERAAAALRVPAQELRLELAHARVRASAGAAR
jgi:hypothetical protein